MRLLRYLDFMTLTFDLLTLKWYLEMHVWCIKYILLCVLYTKFELAICVILFLVYKLRWHTQTYIRIDLTCHLKLWPLTAFYMLTMSTKFVLHACGLALLWHICCLNIMRLWALHKNLVDKLHLVIIVWLSGPLNYYWVNSRHRTDRGSHNKIRSVERDVCPIPALYMLRVTLVS